MKPILTALAATVLFSPSAYTLASASKADLSVKGIIAPVACEPTLSNAGQIDLGKISRQDLNIDKRTRLRDETLDLSIRCIAPVRFALRMRDNRDGTALVDSEIYYGLNLDSSNNKIGLYSLHFDPATTVVDALPEVYRTDSTTGGTAWSTSNTRPIPIGARSYLGFTNLSGSTAGPVAIQHLNSQVTLQTVIAPTSELDLSSEIRLDGSATLEVVYP